MNDEATKTTRKRLRKEAKAYAKWGQRPEDFLLDNAGALPERELKAIVSMAWSNWR